MTLDPIWHFKDKLHRLLLLLLFVSLPLAMACSPQDASRLEPYEIESMMYFKEIALGFEFGNASKVTRKWTKDISIFVSGNPSQDIMQELELIIGELNALITDPLQIKIVKNQSKANFHIYFGAASSYALIYPEAANQVSENWGLFFIYWDAKQRLYQGHMYIDTQRASLNEQKHLLREELTQALGLARDSSLYPDSIFQQDWTTTTRYSVIDKDIIALLYHPAMSSGLAGKALDCVLQDILLTRP